MCIGCDLKNGEIIELLHIATTDCKVYMENAAGGFRLHLQNDNKHHVRDIFYCPFCGRRLENGKIDKQRQRNTNIG